MRDGEIVTAIVAGEAGGLAAAYDRYAAALYGYCRTLLPGPDAARATEDTFLVAATRLEGLSDPDRLRPWLYAVARHECHRRLRERAEAADPDEADGAAGQFAAVDIDADRAGRQELTGIALAALGPAEREIIELNLRRELHGDDLASVLGLSRRQADALAARARRQFETALGAVLVARSGRASCARLDDLLAGWDGRLTVALGRRVARHISYCDACAQRKRREVQPALLLGLLPTEALPSGLREQVLSLAVPDAAELAAAAERAGPFDETTGFPVPVVPPQVPAGTRIAAADRRRSYAVAAVAVCAALGGLLIETVAHPAHATPRTSPVALGSVYPPLSGPSSAVGSSSASRQPKSGSRAQPPARPGSGAPAGSPVIITVSPGVVWTTVPASWSPRSPGPSPTVQPTQIRSSSPSTQAGTLTVSPSVVGLGVSPGGPPSGTFLVTANGGPVSYVVTVPAGDQPTLTVSPLSGTLSAGQSVTISVTWNSTSTLNTQLSVGPNGQTVAIQYPALIASPDPSPDPTGS